MTPQPALKQPARAKAAKPRPKPELKVVDQGHGAAAPAPQRPKIKAPSLRPRQRVLERRLRAKAHNAYRGMSWLERTLRFTLEWDLARKRHLGCLNNYFGDFGQRWTHPDWWDFQQARRLADLFGARYDQWVNAQFERRLKKRTCEVLPSHLHGRTAVETYLQAGQDMLEGWAAKERPFGEADFDRYQPQHVLYVANVICEMIELVRVVGDGKGLNTDSLSTDDLWLSLSTLDMGWSLPSGSHGAKKTPAT